MLKALGLALTPGGPPMPWPDLSLANVGGMLVPRLSRFVRGDDDAKEPSRARSD